MSRKVPSDGRPASTPDGNTPTNEKLPDGQAKSHWVLPVDEIALGFTRPLRSSYIHDVCGAATYVPLSVAKTYARDPHFYGRTFCARCRNYYPVGEDGEFHWLDSEGNTLPDKVGT